MYKPYKITISKPAVEGISELIFQVSIVKINTDERKLLLATLAEIKLSFDKRLCEPKKEYRFTLKPNHAIALRLLHSMFPETTTYIGNKLHQIANDVHRIYHQ